MYAKYFKRPFDFVLSLIALIALSPLLLLLIIIGAIVMKGNPIFTQIRPGKDEKLFKMIKFRTMTCERDSAGKLLPDEDRLTRYGSFLRKSSLDELLELINIVKGDMSLVGPRPLLVRYLPLYNERQKRRHEVRPGLTGLAQVSGRNALSWEDKFELDVGYIDGVSFVGDVRILIGTVGKVVRRDGISSDTSATMDEFLGDVNAHTIDVVGNRVN